MNEIVWFVLEAKSKGIKIPKGQSNGGGWINLMRTVVPRHQWGDNKQQARKLLRRYLGTPPEELMNEKKPQVKKVKFHKPYIDKKRAPDPNSDNFLLSYEWRSLRMQALKRDGARCSCCGATPKDGVKMNVDHIKPRKVFPHLALDLDNLQVLCEVCNHGKGNWDMTNWRKTKQEVM